MKALNLAIALLLMVCCCHAQSNQSSNAKAQKVKEQLAILKEKQEALKREKEQARRDSLARIKALKDSMEKKRLKPSDIKVDPTGKHFEESKQAKTDAGKNLVELKNEKGKPSSIHREPSKSAKRKCPQCGGIMEKVFDNYSVTCSSCNGRTWVGKGKSKEEARRNRTLQDPCKACKGKGKIILKGMLWKCTNCGKKEK